MITFRQIEANRRNARLSTGPVTEEGRSQQNAVRHGLTTEAAIDALEDAAWRQARQILFTLRCLPSRLECE